MLRWENRHIKKSEKTREKNEADWFIDILGAYEKARGISPNDVFDVVWVEFLIVMIHDFKSCRF